MCWWSCRGRDAHKAFVRGRSMSRQKILSFSESFDCMNPSLSVCLSSMNQGKPEAGKNISILLLYYFTTETTANATTMNVTRGYCIARESDEECCQAEEIWTMRMTPDAFDSCLILPCCGLTVAGIVTICKQVVANKVTVSIQSYSSF